jgi:DNA-binding transcriptional MerR regulator
MSVADLTNKHLEKKIIGVKEASSITSVPTVAIYRYIMLKLVTPQKTNMCAKGDPLEFTSNDIGRIKLIRHLFNLRFNTPMVRSILKQMDDGRGFPRISEYTKIIIKRDAFYNK